MTEQTPQTQVRPYNIAPELAESMAYAEKPFRDEAHAAKAALASPPAPVRRESDGQLLATGFDPTPLEYTAKVNTERADQASDAHVLGQGGPTEVLTISRAQEVAANPKARDVMRKIIDES